MPRRNYYKKVQSARTSRNKKLLIAALILFCLYRLVVLIFGEMGWIKYKKMEAHFNEMTMKMASLKKENAKLTREIYALKNSSDYLEILARDKLGLARPGEIVYYYNPE